MTTDLKSAYSATPINEDVPTDDEALKRQLVKWAQGHAFRYALAHADDGVNWGWFDDAQNVWRWSGEHFDCSPKLCAHLLQQLRLFGATSELFVWRTEAGLKGRILTDAPSANERSYDEAYLLWGAPMSESEGGFTLLNEGAQGLQHAPPTAIAEHGRLQVRHYIDYDADGCAHVVASRLLIHEGGN